MVKRPPLSVRARLAVLTTVSAAVAALMQDGFAPVPAIAFVLLAAAGGVEIGCRLTAPDPAPFVRVSVVVVVLVSVVNGLRAGYPAPACIGVVLVTAGCATEVARRLTGMPYRLTDWLPARPIGRT